MSLNKFPAAFIKLRSHNENDVTSGVKMLEEMAIFDEFNHNTYMENMAYGYYRLNDLKNLTRIFDFITVYENPSIEMKRLKLYDMMHTMSNGNVATNITEKICLISTCTLLVLSAGMVIVKTW